MSQHLGGEGDQEALRDQWQWLLAVQGGRIGYHFSNQSGRVSSGSERRLNVLSWRRTGRAVSHSNE